MLAALAAQLVERLGHRPRLLVGPIGEQRVEDVAHRADAPDERDLLAGQAGRVAVAVPALVVGAGDLLGHAHDVRARARQQLGADRRVAAHELAVLGRERAGLQQDGVGHADLAHVVQQARVAQRLGLGRGHAQLQPEALAHAADALEVQAGLLVARLGGLGEAVDDLELRLAQLDGALAHGLLELDVAPRDAEALAALGGVPAPMVLTVPSASAKSGIGDRQDAPVRRRRAGR